MACSAHPADSRTGRRARPEPCANLCASRVRPAAGIKGSGMAFMAGKRALIVGLASPRSIAWGIAQAFSREGAELAFTYQNEKLRPRVEKMAGELGSTLLRGW